MSTHWFLVESITAVGEIVALDAREARHAVGPRRLRDGDAITVFDGAGTIGRGRLMERGRSASIEAIDRVERPSSRVEIAAAVPKGDRVGTLLDMATQLGMTTFIPLRARHSVVDVGVKASGRWMRICVEACKQSQRPWLPIVREEAMAPVECVAEAIDARMLVLLADRDGQSPATLVRPAGGRTETYGGIRVLVGPEGGFDAAERSAMLEAGAQPLRLGSHVLRIETAAVAACAALHVMLDRATSS